MQVVKTVKIPVHYASTKQKLRILDRLKAQLTYGVLPWSQLIGANDIRSRRDLRKAMFERWVREQTGLSAGFVQCCADTAFWMWKSYRELHRNWEQKVRSAQRKGDERWLSKIVKREPRSRWAEVDPAQASDELPKRSVRLEAHAVECGKVSL